MTQSSFESYMDTSLKSSQIILDNLRRASNLIQSFKQISVDQSSDEFRNFNVKEYIQSIINSLKPAIKNTSYIIELHCDENLTILSNPGVYSQIFSNISQHIFQYVPQIVVKFAKGLAQGPGPWARPLARPLGQALGQAIGPGPWARPLARMKEANEFV